MKVLQDIQDYLRTSIDKPNLELEYIYGGRIGIPYPEIPF